MSTESLLFVYDFTLPFNHVDGQTNETPISMDIATSWASSLINELKKYCKQWVFQLEKGDNTGFIHYQGKLSLVAKKRMQNVIKLFAPFSNKFRFSPTVTCNKGMDFYVTKNDTRLFGPWSDKDEDKSEPTFISENVKKMTTLRPFQQQIVSTAENQSQSWENRLIYLVYDKTGNIGKSALCSYMHAHKKAVMVPFCYGFKDAMRYVYDIYEPWRKNGKNINCLLFDIPRALPKNKLSEFFSALEQIKSEFIFDDRYHGRCMQINSPCIFVFSNKLPDFKCLSQDRWVIIRVNRETQCLEMVPEDIIKSHIEKTKIKRKLEKTKYNFPTQF